MHLLLYTSLALAVSAAYLPLQPRVDQCEEEVEDTEYVQADGITADGTAGIGAEFESPFFYFVNQACNTDDTNAAKKETVSGRTGTNWFLSADTGAGSGKLNAEYILNGQTIKVGTGDGQKAGKAVADDLIGWKPWTGDPPNTVTISNNNCNPWKIDAPSKNTKPEDVPWEPQITTPMPLEALYSLMKEQLAQPAPQPGRNILDGICPRGDYLIVVTQEYFQSNINGIDGSKVTDDVLGFCSLVLSYAKAASNKLQKDQSPKLFLTFMPRTEFNTIFSSVKSKIPGDLFDLFNSLACYTIDKNGNVVVDTAYCKGPVAKPVSNNKFGALSYTNSAPDPPASVNIKSWIQGIGSGSTTPDALSEFDQSIDRSIGGLGDKMEKMYNSQRSAPLFEFRDLLDIKTSGIEDFMGMVDSTIQQLHKDFAKAPDKKKKKRQAAANCTLAGAATSSPPSASNLSSPPPTSTPSPVVVAPVDPPSQPSCVPLPTSSVKDSHEDELEKAAAFFCSQYASNTNAQAPINVAQTVIAGDKSEGRETINIAYLYPPSLGNQDDVYDISLTSVPNCTPAGGFNLANPVANNQCADILHSAWRQCNNQGRGGQITAGCLVYSVKTKY